MCFDFISSTAKVLARAYRLHLVHLVSLNMFTFDKFRRQNRGIRSNNFPFKMLIVERARRTRSARLSRLPVGNRTRFCVTANFSTFNGNTLFSFYRRTDGRVFLHPSSVNSDERQFASQWLVYHDKVMRIVLYFTGPGCSKPD